MLEEESSVFAQRVPKDDQKPGVIERYMLPIQAGERNDLDFESAQ